MALEKPKEVDNKWSRPKTSGWLDGAVSTKKEAQNPPVELYTAVGNAERRGMGTTFTINMPKAVNHL